MTLWLCCTSLPPVLPLFHQRLYDFRYSEVHVAENIDRPFHSIGMPACWKMHVLYAAHAERRGGGPAVQWRG